MGAQLKILIAEDEVICAMHMNMQLTDVGFVISDQVTTGENAIIRAKQNPPDVILMDIRLAGKIDGIEAVSVINNESPIPVIFITGYDDQGLKERAQKFEPLGYIIKPIEMDAVKKLIDKRFA